MMNKISKLGVIQRVIVKPYLIQLKKKKKDISKHSKILSCINGASYNFHVMKK